MQIIRLNSRMCAKVRLMPAKLDANRRNTQKSTGPKTANAKA